MGYVAHTNNSHAPFSYAIGHPAICASHVARACESCRTYERVMSHIRTSHIIHESHHAFAPVPTHQRSVSHFALVALI